MFSIRGRTYSEVPALSIRGPELRRSLRLVTQGWMFGSVWFVGVGGATMLRLGKLAGFSKMDFNILASLAFAATLAQIPSSLYVESTGLRKHYFITVSVTHRLLWILVGLMPLALLRLSQSTVIWTTMGIIFVSGLFAALAWPPWTTWMGELIPRRIRGRFLARRNLYCVSVQIVAALGFGAVLDWAANPSRPLTALDQPRLIWTLLGVFTVAGLAGASDVLTFRHIRELMPRALPPRPPLRKLLLEPFTNGRFRHFVGAAACMTFAIGLCTASFGLNCKDHLLLSDKVTNLVLMTSLPVGGVISSTFWGRLMERYGLRSVLLLAAGASAVTLWGWVLVPPALPYLVCAAALLDGVMMTGVMLTQFNLLLSFTGKEGRSTYVAAFGVTTALAGVLGGVTGGAISEWAQSFHRVLGPFVLINYQLVFLVGSVVRGASLLWLAGMPDPQGRPVRHLLRQLGVELRQGFIRAPALARMPATPAPPPRPVSPPAQEPTAPSKAKPPAGDEPTAPPRPVPPRTQGQTKRSDP